jgi:hypothetical protein
VKSKAMSFCLTVFGLLCHHDPLHKSRPSLYVGCSILESVQFQRNAQRISLLDPEIKNYASSLYEKALRDSVKQFHQERSEYLARGARSSSVSLLSGQPHGEKSLRIAGCCKYRNARSDILC